MTEYPRRFLTMGAYAVEMDRIIRELEKEFPEFSTESLEMMAIARFRLKHGKEGPK